MDEVEEAKDLCGYRLALDNTCVWPAGGFDGDHIGTTDVDSNWIVEGDIEEPGDEVRAVARYPTCPSPTKWRVERQEPVVGRWVVVSSAVLAKVAPVRHTFRVSRSITWGAVIESGVKVSFPVLEAETKVKFSGEIKLSTSETVAYTVPKGRAMCLYAAAGYVRRTVTRTVYGSAMCNRVNQRTVVLTPHRSVLKVDFA